MKCDCDECGGKGVIECDQCHGSGRVVRSIEFAAIPVSHKHERELFALKSDATRVRKDHAKLCELTPSREQSYTDQLKGALTIIEGQADKLIKDR